MPAQVLPYPSFPAVPQERRASEVRRRPLDARPGVPNGVSGHGGSSLLTGAAPNYTSTLPSTQFLRWRPAYHIQAPSGWMNDPCGPGYEPATGLYHLFFQWSPHKSGHAPVLWESLAWGHATSTDLISWTVSSTPTLTPGPWYDREGCFTGCFVPTGLNGQSDQTTLFYTGISRFPLHYTLPYTRTTETLAAAVKGAGQTGWHKVGDNPILAEPPAALSVTGWRDPFIAPWPAMDRLLGCQGGSTPMLYGMISGGLRDESPTAFLYRVDPTDLFDWAFLGPLVYIGLNHRISRWSGYNGINWECATFMTLSEGDGDGAGGASREFLVFGGEGADPSYATSVPAPGQPQSMTAPRAQRSLQWMSGTLGSEEKHFGRRVPQLTYAMGGPFDNGCLYAVNTFFDPVRSKQIAWGWVTEDDLPQRLVDRQNWSGMLSLPRELSLLCLHHVTGTIRSPLEDITSIEATAETDGTFTVRTLGIAPASFLDGLCSGGRELPALGGVTLDGKGTCFMDVQTYRFEVRARFDVGDACSRIGLTILHDEDPAPLTSTQVSFMPAEETLEITRPDSSRVDPSIHTFAETAPFTLFRFRRPREPPATEFLDVRLFFDESVLEVFVNGRCTFATRVYPPTKRCWGIRFWAADEDGASKLMFAKAWDRLRADIKFA